jgi:hypothetical protein
MGATENLHVSKFRAPSIALVSVYPLKIILDEWNNVGVNLECLLHSFVCAFTNYYKFTHYYYRNYNAFLDIPA